MHKSIVNHDISDKIYHTKDTNICTKDTNFEKNYIAQPTNTTPERQDMIESELFYSQFSSREFFKKKAVKEFKRCKTMNDNLLKNKDLQKDKEKWISDFIQNKDLKKFD